MSSPSACRRTVNAAVHCWRSDVSCCYFTHLEQSATSPAPAHLCRLSEEEAEAVFVQPQLRVARGFRVPHSCDFVLVLAAIGLNALYITN